MILLVTIGQSNEGRRFSSDDGLPEPIVWQAESGWPNSGGQFEYTAQLMFQESGEPVRTYNCTAGGTSLFGTGTELPFCGWNGSDTVYRRTDGGFDPSGRLALAAAIIANPGFSKKILCIQHGQQDCATYSPPFTSSGAATAEIQAALYQQALESLTDWALNIGIDQVHLGASWSGSSTQSPALEASVLGAAVDGAMATYADNVAVIRGPELYAVYGGGAAYLSHVTQSVSILASRLWKDHLLGYLQ